MTLKYHNSSTVSCTYRLSFAVHDSLKFFKVTQFNLQFLHLCLNKKRYKALDLTLFNLSQVLSWKEKLLKIVSAVYLRVKMILYPLFPSPPNNERKSTKQYMYIMYHKENCTMAKLTKDTAPTKSLWVDGREKVSNGDGNNNNCPPKVTWPFTAPSGVWEKNFPLISFHSARGK